MTGKRIAVPESTLTTIGGPGLACGSCPDLVCGKVCPQLPHPSRDCLDACSANTKKSERQVRPARTFAPSLSSGLYLACRETGAKPARYGIVNCPAALTGGRVLLTLPYVAEWPWLHSGERATEQPPGSNANPYGLTFKPPCGLSLSPTPRSTAASGRRRGPSSRSSMAS